MAEHLDDELRVAVLRLSRRTRLERADADVSDTQLSVLFHLWKQGPQTLGSLADLDRVTPPSMNRTVGSLAELGLVTRTASPDDGRKVVIDITPAGAEVASETKRRRAAWFNTALTRLTDEQRAALDVAAPILAELADS
jgi:DNA-binding MarR family transcriptional regulator